MKTKFALAFKTTLSFAFVSILSAAAFAYQDGTYTCKNSTDGYPSNTYKIQSVALPGLAAKVPYVEITRYFPSMDSSNPPTMIESHINGLASVISSTRDGGSTILQIAAFQIEFAGDQFANCKP